MEVSENNNLLEESILEELNESRSLRSSQENNLTAIQSTRKILTDTVETFRSRYDALMKECEVSTNNLLKEYKALGEQFNKSQMILSEKEKNLIEAQSALVASNDSLKSLLSSYDAIMKENEVSANNLLEKNKVLEKELDESRNLLLIKDQYLTEAESGLKKVTHTLETLRSRFDAFKKKSEVSANNNLLEKYKVLEKDLMDAECHLRISEDSLLKLQSKYDDVMKEKEREMKKYTIEKKKFETDMLTLSEKNATITKQLEAYKRELALINLKVNNFKPCSCLQKVKKLTADINTIMGNGNFSSQ